MRSDLFNKCFECISYFCQMRIFYAVSLAVLSIYLISCNSSDAPPPYKEAPPVPSLSYSVISTMPHDTGNFTEGLEFYNNTLLESTGQYGSSKLLQTEPATGKVLKQVVLDPKYFGEGISVLHDTLFQMTYQEHVVFVYTVKDFKKVKELPLSGEGWGMTNDGKNLIVSNGSTSLFYYDPSNFHLVKEVPVTENDTPITDINELEYIDGFIYANQWHYNYIFKIDPASGKVVAKADLTDLVKKNQKSNEDVLNGIAYNPSTKKIYVTGKNWPQIFEVQFSH
jgi:glutamine cyclotransferase